VDVPPTAEPLLTMPRAAGLLARSAAWVKGLCDSGQLACWRVNGRRYTTAGSIRDYLDRRRVTPPRQPVPSARASDRAYAAAMASLERMGV
jgi:hypothetical protein